MRKKIVSADEALALDLVHEVVTDDELPTAAMAMAEEFAKGPQVAMRLLKRSLYNAAEQDWTHALDEIASMSAIAVLHPDAQEGVKAFI